MMNFGYSDFCGFSGVFMVLWWALVVAGIFMLVRWILAQNNGSCNDKNHDKNHDKSANDSSLNILKERYAKGEIDKEEFDEKKIDLS
ncbi:MAG: SHOCT domain-containing protein [Patescibacteria group bacterium]